MADTRPSRILVAHNRYQQPGGEDLVFQQDCELLSASGFDVRRFSVDNEHIRGFGAKVATATSVLSNRLVVEAFKLEIAKFGPDLVHIHNFFPTLSPAVIGTAIRQKIPVILTLHNYRLICPSAFLMRNGRICEDCVGGSKWPAVQHGCYRGSKVGSAVVGQIGPYVRRLVERFPRELTLVALTEFAKSRFIADGFSAESIVVRGNYIGDPGVGLSTRERRIVYVGRLSLEKGLDTLLVAARGLDGVIEIIGDGPERKRLEKEAPSNVVFRGSLTSTEVFKRLSSATALALPSRWYEGFPMVLLEAMATGTPVVASRIGGIGEIVDDGKTGLLIAPHDVSAWREALAKLLDAPAHAGAIGRQARERFLTRHSLDLALSSLASLYQMSLSKATTVPL